MSYFFAVLAVVWLADGLALLVAPRQVIALVKESLERSPGLLRWEIVAAAFGLLLLVGAHALWLPLMWRSIGVLMILKGLFFALGPEPLRQRALEWCVRREDVDYRFWGLGLCALSMLLLSALGWLPPG